MPMLCLLHSGSSETYEDCLFCEELNTKDTDDCKRGEGEQEHPILIPAQEEVGSDNQSSSPPHLKEEQLLPPDYPKFLTSSMEQSKLAFPDTTTKTPTSTSYYAKQRLVCKICLKTLWSQRTYDDHMRLHTGETPFSCHVCHRRFTSMTVLRNHRTDLNHPKCQLARNIRRRRKRSAMNRLREAACSPHITAPQTLSPGPLYVDDDGPPTPAPPPPLPDLVKSLRTKCFRNMSGNGAANVHLQSNSASASFCEELRPSPSAVVSLAIKEVEQTFVCPICSKTLASELSFTYHMNFYHRSPSITESQSDPELEEDNESSKNLSDSDYEPDPKLYEYNDDVDTQYNLKNKQNKKVACGFCEKVLFVRNMEDHIRGHTGEKPFKCPRCEKGFSSRAARWKCTRRCKGNGIPIAKKAPNNEVTSDTPAAIIREEFPETKEVPNFHLPTKTLQIGNFPPESNKIVHTKISNSNGVSSRRKKMGFHKPTLSFTNASGVDDLTSRRKAKSTDSTTLTGKSCKKIKLDKIGSSGSGNQWNLSEESTIIAKLPKNHKMASNRFTTSQPDEESLPSKGNSKPKCRSPGKWQHICSACSLRFQTASYLTLHQNMCVMYSRKKMSPIGVKQHVQESDVPARLKLAASIGKAEEECNNVKPKPRKCTNCQAKFSSVKSLNEHLWWNPQCCDISKLEPETTQKIVEAVHPNVIQTVGVNTKSEASPPSPLKNIPTVLPPVASPCPFCTNICKNAPELLVHIAVAHLGI